MLVRTVEPGDIVSPGKRLLVVNSRGETRLTAQIDEKNLPYLKIEQAAGVKGTDIAFKGAGDFKSAVIGGHVDYAFSSIGEFLTGYADSDIATAMLVVNPTRVAVIKDVPSIKELGFDVRVSSERGIAAPKALPQNIADRLQKAIQDTLADPEFLKTIKNDAPLVAFMPGPDWTKSLESMPAELMPFVSKMKE